jgi:tRNA(fMet)-specific endonuclease VapC
MNKALIDTDIFSEIGKGMNSTVIRNATVYRAAFGRLTTSVVTIMEIVKGYQKSQTPGRLQLFLSKIVSEEILDFNQAAAELGGRIAGDLERTGQTIGMADPMIAAMALVHGLELVTGNTNHFQRIQQLGHPLKLVNWRV